MLARGAVVAEFPTGAAGKPGYQSGMSFTEVMDELPALTVAERQRLVHRALILDEADLTAGEVALTAGEMALVERRLADHHRNPGSAVPLDEMRGRLRARFAP